jgi:hypothetical protein
VREATEISRPGAQLRKFFLTGDARYGSLGKFSFDLSQLVGNTKSEVRDDTEFEVTELYADPLSLDSGALSFRVGSPAFEVGRDGVFSPHRHAGRAAQPVPERGRSSRDWMRIKIAHISPRRPGPVRS